MTSYATADVTAHRVVTRHNGLVRTPKRRRPRRRTVAAAPTGVDLTELAGRVSYVGSAEHKSFPSFAGRPQLRADASKCSPDLADPAELTRWLREALSSGALQGLSTLVR